MTSGPIKRSSIHHLHAERRAKFVVQHGWEVPASFGDVNAERNAIARGVALGDVSWLGKLECKGPWVAGLASRQPADGVVACPVTPTRLLYIVGPSSIDSGRDALESARAGQRESYLIDVSSVYASFDIMGPKTADMLSKITSAWPDMGAPIFSSFAGVRSLLIRTERGLQIHFAREFGEYLWKTLLDAGREFEILPVGTEAM